MCCESTDRLSSVENLSHLEGQLIRGEGLLKEGRATVGDASANDLVVRVPGHEEYANVRNDRGESFDERSAAHLRHHDIRGHEMDLPCVSLDQSEGPLARTRNQY